VLLVFLPLSPILMKLQTFFGFKKGEISYEYFGACTESAFSIIIKPLWVELGAEIKLNLIFYENNKQTTTTSTTCPTHTHAQLSAQEANNKMDAH